MNTRSDLTLLGDEPCGASRGGPPQGAVLLFRGRGFVSRLIRWQTRSCYSHAALLLPDGRVVESWQGAGVRITRLEDWQDVDVFDVAGMTPAQWERAIAFALRQVGHGYDYWAIVRFISRERMPENNRWFCSELVFAAIEDGGVRLLERIKAWAVSPGELRVSPLLIQRTRTHTDAHGRGGTL